MVLLRWLLPKGGGHVRRYLRVRKAVLSRILNNDDRYPPPPVSLFDFACRDDAVDAAKVQVADKDAWRLSDDRVIGGFSESVATLIASREEYLKYLNDEEFTSQALLLDNNNNNDNESVETMSKDKEEGRLQQQPTNQDESDRGGVGYDTTNSFVPFLRWTGNLDTTVGLRSAAQRSGFAALRSPQFPLDGANLHGLFRCLEIVCRSDGRLYTVNLKVATSVPDDIYQGHIQSSPSSSSSSSRGQASGSSYFDDKGNLTGDFETFVLPFADFRLTSMGRQREVCRELDDNICIESVGIALMDGQNGGFQFDLARIRAVNLLHGKVFENIPEEGQGKQSKKY